MPRFIHIGGAAPLTWTATATQSQASPGDPGTYSAVGIGTPAANREVVGLIGWGNALGRTLVGATIGGVTATVVDTYAIAGVNNNIGIIRATVPSGTTAAAVIDWSGSVSAGGFCKLFYGYPATATPLDQGFANAASGGLITVANIQVGIGGILVGVRGGSGGSTSTFGWTGSDVLQTEITSIGSVNAEVAWAFTTQATTTDDFTCDPSGSSTNALLVASWL
jgi:hypothetical protein